MRKCYICNQTKPIEDFEKKSDRPLGRGYRCKPCKNAQTRNWRSDNKDKVTSYNKSYHRSRWDTDPSFVHRKRTANTDAVYSSSEDVKDTLSRIESVDWFSPDAYELADSISRSVCYRSSHIEEFVSSHTEEN